MCDMLTPNVREISPGAVARAKAEAEAARAAGSAPARRTQRDLVVESLLRRPTEPPRSS
jgi:hypothetical protein